MDERAQPSNRAMPITLLGTRYGRSSKRLDIDLYWSMSYCIDDGSELER